MFGEVKFGEPDFDFVNSLRYNNAVFSAFKTHRQQSELHAAMIDDKGKVRSFAEFRKATAPIIGKYNVNWLQTEYSTAIKRAEFARQWREMEADAGTRPNFQWLPSTAVEPRSEHSALYHKIWPLGDPFLSTTYPGCAWGCLCSGRSTAEPPTDRSEIKKAAKSTPPPSKGLDQNPAQSGALFSASHPYIATCGKQEQKSVALVCQKMMSERSRNEVRQFFKEKIKTATIVVDNPPLSTIQISYQDVKTITGKPHKYNYERNQCCYFLPEILKEATYEGLSADIKPGQNGHQGVLRWQYYSFKLNNELSYITVKETQEGIFRIHSIQDADHFKKIKIQKSPKPNE